MSFFTHLIFILLIFSAAVFVSLLFAFWHGYPSGYDAPSHVFRVSFVSQFWPHINWLPVWAQGMPLFMRYPPLAFIILGLISRLTAFSAQQLVTGAGVFAVGLGGVGIYLFINQLTRSKLASLAGAILYLFTPSTWMMGRTGGYARAYAIPFLILAFWAVTVVLSDLVEKEKRSWPYLLTVLFLGACFLTHYIIGFFAFLLVGFWILGFWGVIKPRNLLLILIKVFIPAALITSPLWLPMLALRTPKNELAVASINWADLRAIPWSWLFNFYDSVQEISPFDVIKLMPFLYPLAAFLGLLAFIVRKGKMAINTVIGRAAWLLIFISISALFYLRIVSPIFKILYAGVLDPVAMLIFVPIFLASLVGILVFYTFRRTWLVAAFSVLIIGGVIVWAGYQYQFLARGWEGLRQTHPFYLKEDKYPLVQAVIDNPRNFNFRFGTATDANLAAWVNIAYPFVPQTRDYFGQGIVNIDDDVYKTHSIWESAENYPETEFILDWFGIDKFVVTSANEEAEGKYEVRPQIYKFLGTHGAFRAFEYASPSPILASTDTPVVLVIGKNAYDVIYRSFAQGNLNSCYLIPVVGKEKIDDYRLEELKKFPLIFLYNYQFKNRDRAFRLMADYVHQGGGLVIESNLFVEEGQDLPEPFPIAVAEKQLFSGSWNLDLATEFQEIDLAKFAPPVYEEGPWGGAVARGAKPWAKVLVSRQGESVIIGGKLGEGKVVWSGMNLPYHILTYHIAEETKFEGLLLAWARGKDKLDYFKVPEGKEKDLTYETADFTAQFINPQEFRLKLKKGTSGALFKEFYFPSWQAKALLTGGRSQRLSIYKAGPRMIYVFTPPETKEIIFHYDLPFVAKLARIIAVLTLIWLLFYLLAERLHLDKIIVPIKRPFERYKIDVSRWWEKDEV